MQAPMAEESMAVGTYGCSNRGVAGCGLAAKNFVTGAV